MVRKRYQLAITYELMIFVFLVGQLRLVIIFISLHIAHYMAGIRELPLMILLIFLLEFLFMQYPMTIADFQ